MPNKHSHSHQSDKRSHYRGQIHSKPLNLNHNQKSQPVSDDAWYEKELKKQARKKAKQERPQFTVIGDALPTGEEFQKKVKKSQKKSVSEKRQENQQRVKENRKTKKVRQAAAENELKRQKNVKAEKNVTLFNLHFMLLFFSFVFPNKNEKVKKTVVAENFLRDPSRANLPRTSGRLHPVPSSSPKINPILAIAMIGMMGVNLVAGMPNKKENSSGNDRGTKKIKPPTCDFINSQDAVNPYQVISELPDTLTQESTSVVQAAGEQVCLAGHAGFVNSEIAASKLRHQTHSEMVLSVKDTHSTESLEEKNYDSSDDSDDIVDISSANTSEKQSSDMKLKSLQADLISAAKQGDMEVIQLLFKSDVDPFKPLYSATVENKQKIEFENAENLIEFIETVSFLQCHTAFSCAFLSGKVEPIQFFLDSTREKVNNNLVLRMAAQTQGRISLEQLKFLVSRGFELDFKFGFKSADEKMSVLHFAAVLPYPDFLSSLLSLTTSRVNEKDSEGRTPLHYAVKAYMQSGLIVKDPQATPFTLHAIKTLVMNGADESIKDNQGLMPIDLSKLYRGEFQEDFYDADGNAIMRNLPLQPNPYGESNQFVTRPIHLDDCLAIYSSERMRECVLPLKPASESKYPEAARDLVKAFFAIDRRKQEAIFSCFTPKEVKSVIKIVRSKLTDQAVEDLLQVYKEQCQRFDNGRNHPVLKNPHLRVPLIEAAGPTDITRVQDFYIDVHRYRVVVVFKDPHLRDMQLDMATEYFSGSLEKFVLYLELGIPLPNIITENGGHYSLLTILTDKDGFYKVKAVLDYNKKIGKESSYVHELEAAASLGSTEIMALLSGYGADLNFYAEKAQAIRVIPNSLMHLSEVAANYVCDSIFSFAMLSGSVEPLKFLIEEGYVRSVQQATEIALLSTRGIITEEQLRYLMQHGFVLDRTFWYDSEAKLPLQPVRESQITHFHILAVLPNTNALKAMLAITNKQVDLRDSEGRTPLHAAVLAVINSRQRAAKNSNYIPIDTDGIKALIKAGANLEIKDNRRKTPQQLIPKEGFEDLHKIFNDLKPPKTTSTIIEILLGIGVLGILVYLGSQKNKRLQTDFNSDELKALNSATCVVLRSKWVFGRKGFFENKVVCKSANKLTYNGKILTVTAEIVAKAIKEFFDEHQLQCEIAYEKNEIILRVPSSDSERLKFTRRAKDDLLQLVFLKSPEYQQAEAAEAEHKFMLQEANDLRDKFSGVCSEKKRCDDFRDKIAGKLSEVIKEIEDVFSATLLRHAHEVRLNKYTGDEFKAEAYDIQISYDYLKDYIPEEYKKFVADYDELNKFYVKQHEKCLILNQQNLVALEVEQRKLTRLRDKIENLEKQYDSEILRLRNVIIKFNQGLERFNNRVTPTQRTISRELHRQTMKERRGSSTPVEITFGKKPAAASQYEGAFFQPKQAHEIYKYENDELFNSASHYATEIKEVYEKKHIYTSDEDKQIFDYTLSYYILKWLGCTLEMKGLDEELQVNFGVIRHALVHNIAPFPSEVIDKLALLIQSDPKKIGVNNLKAIALKVDDKTEYPKNESEVILICINSMRSFLRFCLNLRNKLFLSNTSNVYVASKFLLARFGTFYKKINIASKRCQLKNYDNRVFDWYLQKDFFRNCLKLRREVHHNFKNKLDEFYSWKDVVVFLNLIDIQGSMYLTGMKKIVDEYNSLMQQGHALIVSLNEPRLTLAP